MWKKIRAFMPKWCRDGIWVVDSDPCHGEFWAQYFEKKKKKNLISWIKDHLVQA